MLDSAPAASGDSRGADRPAAMTRAWKLAVIGNPNTGKTTLFNALTGLSQHTGNYPGVTVESALGEFVVDGQRVEAVDLPGSYSLAPRAPDEMVAVEVLLGRGRDVDPPDAVLCVVDATHLDRNLYLLTQVLETELPVVVALTMVDVAQRQGLTIDIGLLESRLGVPVVPVHATRRRGIEDLERAVVAAMRQERRRARAVLFPSVFEEAVSRLRDRLPREADGSALPKFLVERLLIDAGGYVESTLARELGSNVLDETEAARQELSSKLPALPRVEVEARYRWIAEALRGATEKASLSGESVTDRVDRIVTHKVWGSVVFLLAMATTFQAIFSWAVPFMDAIDGAMQVVGASIAAIVPEGPIRSLLVDGVVGGVGAVVVFVPQIAILFALITVLEDSGYMARAAFLMDRVMSGFGLSGRSFIPLLSSFACAVPGIMAARSIENPRDRLATILIAPLMSCSARLPVYVLFIAAFVPATTIGGVIGLQGLTLFSLYLVGLLVAPPIALLLKKTALRGPAVPFLLELPPYKVPSWRVVLFRMYDRSWAFIRRAGTIILATTILVWALSYYPRPQANEAPAPNVASDAQQAGEHLRQSYLGQAGHVIEPIVEPLGWDWKIGMAVIASFPAREVVIAALGTIYNLGGGEGEDSVELRDALRAARRPDGSPVYTAPVALSIMVFFALCCQCAATLATIRRETGSWRYPAFTFVYMTSLAYVAAYAVYQVGTFLMGTAT